jgi:hypothetical protein
MDLVIAFSIIFFIGLIFLLFYNYFYKSRKEQQTMLVPGELVISDDFEQTVLKPAFMANRSEIVLPGYGNGLTFKWHMYIDNPHAEKSWASNYSRDKPLVRIDESPQILYNPKYNILKLRLKYRESPFYAHYPIIEVRDIPLRRWNYFVITIDGAHIRIYLDGRLIMNKILPNEPVITTSDIVVGEQGNNFMGRLRDFQVYFRPYDTQAIRVIL